MIKISIERVTTEKYTEVKNFIVKSTPTDKIQSRGSGYDSDKVLCAEEYATRDVPAERTVTTKLLSQEILNEESFDLASVIAAINKLQLIAK